MPSKFLTFTAVMTRLAVLLPAFAGLSLAFSCQSPDNGERPETGIVLDSLVMRVAIPSSQMNKVFNANVILPDGYYEDSTANFYPVVYLLHGYSGNYANWYERVPNLPELASRYDLIIVTPEGNYNSWYLDSPLDSTQRFFTYISLEVPRYIDAHFRTFSNARNRAIAGLSMGGHGALSIAMARPEGFSMAGSMSGVVDLTSMAEKLEVKDHLGEYAADTLLWQQHSVLHIAAEQRTFPELIFDCGTSDEFIDANRKLNELLRTRGVAHTFIERPGNYDWLYWQEAVEVQLAFFARRFSRG